MERASWVLKPNDVGPVLDICICHRTSLVFGFHFNPKIVDYCTEVLKLRWLYLERTTILQIRSKNSIEANEKHGVNFKERKTHHLKALRLHAQRASYFI